MRLLPFSGPFCAVVSCLLLAALPASAAKLVRGPYLQDLSSRQAAVLLELDAPHDVTVEVFRGVAEDAGAPVKTVKSASKETIHELVAGGLEPATSYRYLVTTDDGTVERGAFATAPEDDRAFSFLLYGDNRSNAAAHALVVKGMVASPGDFVVNTGDMVYDGSDPSEWIRFFAIERDLLRGRCLFPAIGNHEISLPTSDGALRFARAFRLPAPMGANERWYSFRWGMARFFVLDAQDEFGSEERDWLEGALKGADGENGLVYRFVVMHHGPFSSGLHGPNRAALIARVPELLRDHKVDAVFTGHDHIYERGEGGGLRYIVTGGGGAPLYREYHGEKSTQKFESTHHFLRVEVGRNLATTTAVRADGSLIERCSFAPGSLGWSCGGAVPVAPSGSIAPAAAATGASPEVPPSPPRKSCGCEILREGPGWLGLGVAAGALLVWVLRRGARTAGKGRGTGK